MQVDLAKIQDALPRRPRWQRSRWVADRRWRWGIEWHSHSRPESLMREATGALEWYWCDFTCLVRLGPMRWRWDRFRQEKPYEVMSQEL